MPAISKILLIAFLGSFCFAIFIVFSYCCWKRAFLQRANTQLENPEYEVEEIPGTTDFVMVGRRGHTKTKVKKPKLWDIRVPGFGGRFVHERKVSSGSSFSDLSLCKDVGYWVDLKPMTVTYVKNPTKTHVPPIPPFPVDPLTGRVSGPTTLTVDGNALLRDLVNSSQSSLLQRPSRDTPSRPIPGPPPAEAHAADNAGGTSKRQKHESMSGYDKSTIEAVQVSVLIAMPQRPTAIRRHTTASAGPLEVGIVNIPLGHSAPRWSARQSIRPSPQ
ncbi:hypothetical protein BJ322DRAFT_601990 [Thelephora terrestris]|uniref:Uncharacterized protein n=1 Tax=Thelephora terrestris TaxID=56493 RepID=A0A9P6L9H7_9AGAM|nr:hypothetical protein BJ322DRAFT_601990 [Thelephora terrestris]